MYGIKKASKETHPEYIVDAFGVKTHWGSIPNGKSYLGENVGWPESGDFHATREEYDGAALCIDSRRKKDSLVMAEWGAGWAPWSCFGQKYGGLKKVKNFSFQLVEASHRHMQKAINNLIANEVTGYTLLHGALSGEDGTLEFPRIENMDFGAGLETERPSDFFLRKRYKFDKVASYSPATLLDREEYFDLVHIDVQGKEVDLFNAGEDWENVRGIVIGTHGVQIADFLRKRVKDIGFKLELETSPQLERGVLRIDGLQVWRR